MSLLRSRSLGEGDVLSTEEAARQAAGVLQRFDSSGDGKLQFDEFVALCVASAQGVVLPKRKGKECHYTVKSCTSTSMHGKTNGSLYSPCR